jgi:hypothetical protein
MQLDRLASLPDLRLDVDPHTLDSSCLPYWG